MKQRPFKERVERNVARGIKFLNREYGRSWVRIIDPEVLALQDGKACILGQLEGSYEWSCKLFNLETIESRARLGITLSVDDDDSVGSGRNWKYLTKVWREVLKSYA